MVPVLAQRGSPGFVGLKQNSGTAQIASHYRRGMFTLETIRRLPIVEYPQLASYAIFWLPVQCYYAVHGVGLAALLALGHAPKDHGAFCAAFAESIIKRFFPEPIDASCGGGPSLHYFTYPRMNVSVSEVTQHNVLASNVGREEILVGKSLSTTRQRILDIKFEAARKTEKRKRLSSELKRAISQNLGPTTICDYFYRIRLRSNYDDADMYIVGLDDSGAALEHYSDLLFLTEIIVAGVNLITKRKIGDEQMAAMHRPLL